MYRLLKTHTFHNGAGRVGTIWIAPATFAAQFPQPSVVFKGKYTDGKVDRIWQFSRGGDHFDVYAYKATSHYLLDLPTPEEFWASTQPFNLTIASLHNCTDFVIHMRGSLPGTEETCKVRDRDVLFRVSGAQF